MDGSVCPSIFFIREVITVRIECIGYNAADFFRVASIIRKDRILRDLSQQVNDV